MQVCVADRASARFGTRTEDTIDEPHPNAGDEHPASIRAADPVSDWGEGLLAATEEVCPIERGGWAYELVGRVVARLNEVASTDYRAVILWLRHANAHAVPGRYIYVSRELLSRGLSEAGVAFVVAHEMAHHLLGHLDAAEQRIRAEGLPARAEAAVRHVVEMLTFTAERELEADRLAIDLCLAAGYGADGARETFALLTGIALDHGAIDHAYGGDAPTGEPSVLDRLLGSAPTHPALDARIEAAERWIGAPARAEAALDTWTPSELASTSLFCACARCALRFAERPFCPGCGAVPVPDLRDDAQRQQFVKEIYAQAFARSGRGTALRQAVRRAWPGMLITAGGVLAGLAGWAADSSELLFIGSMGSVVGIATEALRYAANRDENVHVAEGLPELVREGTTLQIHGGAPRREGRRASIVGRVHVIAAVRAPLSNLPCGAYRVVGVGPSGPLDDAEVGAFEVRAADGELAVVRANEALVDLPTEDEPGRVEARDLHDFLRPRGLLPDEATCEVVEVTLREGDLVEVSGVCEQIAVPTGLRGTREATSFTSWPTIRLRRPPAGRAR